MKLLPQYLNYLPKRVLSYYMSRDGATAIEYALIAAGIATAIVAIVFTIGGSTQQAFTDVNAQLTASP